MNKKKIPVDEQLCRDCKHARPVTREHLDLYGNPIFCTCEYQSNYWFLNFRESIRKNCQHYEK